MEHYHRLPSPAEVRDFPPEVITSQWSLYLEGWSLSDSGADGWLTDWLAGLLAQFDAVLLCRCDDDKETVEYRGQETSRRMTDGRQS